MPANGRKKARPDRPGAKPKPWERRSAPWFDNGQRETDAAWEAFVVYRDMGPNRSLAKAGRIVGRRKQVLDAWSSKHEWRSRVEQWEAELDRMRLAGQAAEAVKMAKRHIQLGQAMYSKGAQRMQTLEPVQLSPSEARRYVETGTKVELVARGLPDSTVRIVEDYDFAQLDTDEKRLLLTLLAKAKRQPT